MPDERQGREGMSHQLRIGGRDFDTRRGPFIVGIVNMSPESPNRDSVAADPAAAVARARRLTQGGAEVIDVGGRSSNPAATRVSWRVELERVVPAVRALKDAGFLVSVDTWNPRVARAATDAGADVINDSGGLQDPRMLAVAAERGVPVVAPFMTGRSPLRSRPAEGPDPMAAVLVALQVALERARAAGIDEVLVDPGIGYEPPGMRPEDLEAYQQLMLAELPRLAALGRPILAAVLRRPDPEATAAIARRLVTAGVSFLRCHDAEVVAGAVRDVVSATPPRAPYGSSRV